MQTRNDLTGKPALMRELNIGLIKDALAKYQKATRVELSMITGISQPTVNMLIKQLQKERVVISDGMAQSTGGRKAEVFLLNNKRSYILSVTVREKYFEYAVTDMELGREAYEKTARDSGSMYLDQLCLLIRRILKEHKYIGAIAVGVPGAVSEEGQIFAVPQIPEWEKLNLKKYLEREFGFPVIVMNDINAVAFGYASSVRMGTQNMVYLQVGKDGVGAGIIVDGKLYPGFKSFAGEVGYLQIEHGEKAENRLAEMTGTRQAHFLEKIITNIICILNPEKIVLDGEDVPQEICEQAEAACREYLPDRVMPQLVRIESGADYYFRGLGEMGRMLLDNNIRLA